MMNKPQGTLTAARDKKQKTVMDLLPPLYAAMDCMPAGRLDKDTCGLLLLTDDGELKNRLTHPSHSLPKVYRVKVAEQITEEQLRILLSPLVIDGYEIKPVEVKIASIDEGGSVLKMTLLEGRNRQIRKMCEQVGLTVKRLSRVSIGNLKLDGLPVGKWRYLEQDEVDYLYKATKGE